MSHECVTSLFRAGKNVHTSLSVRLNRHVNNNSNEKIEAQVRCLLFVRCIYFHPSFSCYDRMVRAVMSIAAVGKFRDKIFMWLSNFVMFDANEWSETKYFWFEIVLMLYQFRGVFFLFHCNICLLQHNSHEDISWHLFMFKWFR